MSSSLPKLTLGKLTSGKTSAAARCLFIEEGDGETGEVVSFEVVIAVRSDMSLAQIQRAALLRATYLLLTLVDGDGSDFNLMNSYKAAIKDTNPVAIEQETTLPGAHD